MALGQVRRPKRPSNDGGGVEPKPQRPRVDAAIANLADASRTVDNATDPEKKRVPSGRGPAGRLGSVLIKAAAAAAQTASQIRKADDLAGRSAKLKAQSVQDLKRRSSEKEEEKDEAIEAPVAKFRRADLAPVSRIDRPLSSSPPSRASAVKDEPLRTVRIAAAEAATAPVSRIDRPLSSSTPAIDPDSRWQANAEPEESPRSSRAPNSSSSTPSGPSSVSRLDRPLSSTTPSRSSRSAPDDSPHSRSQESPASRRVARLTPTTETPGAPSSVSRLDRPLSSSIPVQLTPTDYSALERENRMLKARLMELDGTVGYTDESPRAGRASLSASSSASRLDRPLSSSSSMPSRAANGDLGAASRLDRPLSLSTPSRAASGELGSASRLDRGDLGSASRLDRPLPSRVASGDLGAASRLDRPLPSSTPSRTSRLDRPLPSSTPSRTAGASQDYRDPSTPTYPDMPNRDGSRHSVGRDGRDGWDSRDGGRERGRDGRAEGDAAHLATSSRQYDGWGDDDKYAQDTEHPRQWQRESGGSELLDARQRLNRVRSDRSQRSDGPTDTPADEPWDGEYRNAEEESSDWYSSGWWGEDWSDRWWSHEGGQHDPNYTYEPLVVSWAEEDEVTDDDDTLRSGVMPTLTLADLQAAAKAKALRQKAKTAKVGEA